MLSGCLSLLLTTPPVSVTGGSCVPGHAISRGETRHWEVLPLLDVLFCCLWFLYYSTPPTPTPASCTQSQLKGMDETRRDWQEEALTLNKNIEFIIDCQ